VLASPVLASPVLASPVLASPVLVSVSETVSAPVLVSLLSPVIPELVRETSPVVSVAPLDIGSVLDVVCVAAPLVVAGPVLAKPPDELAASPGPVEPAAPPKAGFSRRQALDAAIGMIRNSRIGWGSS